MSYLSGKTVLVTGACGTIGRVLVEQILTRHDIAQLIAIDNNETELVFLEERWRGRGTRFVLCDIRNLDLLAREARKVDVLFHAAAFKHVNMCERSPMEAVRTNVIGVQNVVQTAIDNGIRRLIFASTDKAVNPTNVMGASKLLGEHLVTAAALDRHQNGAVFLSTRFGNVLGSRGSVIPIFLSQIRAGQAVTITDPRMTRFIMSADDAVRLLINSGEIGRPGEVLITKMSAVRVGDLAEVIIREAAPLLGRRAADIETRIVGPRPGEKHYEELMNDEEKRRAEERGNYFVVRPAIWSNEESAAAPASATRGITSPYNSDNVEPLTQDQLARMLHGAGIFDAAKLSMN